jgi:hypothetical protein
MIFRHTVAPCRIAVNLDLGMMREYDFCHGEERATI